MDQIHAMEKLKLKDLDLQVFVKLVPPLHDELIVVEVSLYFIIESFENFPLPLIYSNESGTMRLPHSTRSIFFWIPLASPLLGWALRKFGSNPNANLITSLDSLILMQSMRKVSFSGTQLSIGNSTVKPYMPFNHQ